MTSLLVGGTSLINQALFLKHIQLLQTTSGTHTASRSFSQFVDGKENAKKSPVGPCFNMRSEVQVMESMGFSTSQPMGFGFERSRIQGRPRSRAPEPTGSNGSNDRSAYPKQFFIAGGFHSHGATPIAGWFSWENPKPNG